MTLPLPPWPYPLWIAHRGAGLLAPENTLAALQFGNERGFRMAECDVTLSADDVAFLLHDARLERTTCGHGHAVALPWDQLARLDAGGWHGPRHKGEPLPSLEAVARLAQARGLALNLEIKPALGDDERCGRVTATAAAHLWAGHEPAPLLSSFSHPALVAAMQAAPALPRARLFERLAPGWIEESLALGCVAVVAAQAALDAAHIAAAHAAGLRMLAYTVNEREDARRLLAAGIDGLITDAIDRFAPDAASCG